MGKRDIASKKFDLHTIAAVTDLLEDIKQACQKNQERA